jgi:hypothetical protein
MERHGGVEVKLRSILNIVYKWRRVVISPALSISWIAGCTAGLDVMGLFKFLGVG